MIRNKVIKEMAPPTLVAWERSTGTFLNTSKLRTLFENDITISANYITRQQSTKHHGKIQGSVISLERQGVLDKLIELFAVAELYLCNTLFLVIVVMR